MKPLLLLLLLAISGNCFGQWTTLNVPSGGRYDDLVFLNDSVGWAAGGNTYRIYKTTDRGVTWVPKFLSPAKYLRSIVFATPTLGFCGSLDSAFYKTTDGGNTWTDIAATISPKPPGICGLAAPTPNVIYGCGIWSSPAYLIKSTDGGNTWTRQDLSALASALVEVHFISADTGFVAGRANPASDGGIILYTTNGGTTWTVKHKTMTANDYVWKLQSPDGQQYFGAISGRPGSGNVRFASSPDKGQTWNTSLIRNSYTDIQAIGFITPLKGWTGGNTALLETSDGGLTWNNIAVGTSFNRFLKLNDSTAFLTGQRIYKYRNGRVTGLSKPEPFDEIHRLTVSPNPASNFVNIKLKVPARTHCALQLLSAEGKVMQTIHDQPLNKGTHHFKASLANLPAQILFLVLQTNEGTIYRKIIKQ